MPSRRNDEDGESRRRCESERDDDSGSPRRRKPTPGRDREDEDGPRRRAPGSRRDDDNERPPRGASRRDDDDERPGRSQKTRGVHPALYVGAGVLVALAAGGLIWAFAGKGKPSSQQPTGSQTASNAAPGQNTPAVGDRDQAAPGANQGTPTNGERAKIIPEEKTTTPPSGAPDNNPPAKTPVNNVGPPAAGELSSEMEEKIKRATALIRVTTGDYRASGSGFILRSNGDTAYVLTNYHVVATPPEEPAPKTPPKTSPQPPKGRPGVPGIPNSPFPHPGPPNLPGMGFRGGPNGFTGIGRPPGFGILGAPGMGQPNLGLPGLVPPGNTEAKKPNDPPPKPRARVTVVLRSGTPEEQSVQAELVAFDDEADLAALRITGARNLPAAIDVSQDAPLAETMPVFIFGFPGGVRSVELSRKSAGTPTTRSGTSRSMATSSPATAAARSSMQGAGWSALPSPRSAAGTSASRSPRTSSTTC
jgi:S1-C subfamily serine protease